MDKKDIDNKYIKQHNDLEKEFFDIMDEGLPNQRRVLKDGKTMNEFNQKHSEIWRNHEAQLITEGFLEIQTPPEPNRDLEAEVDALDARLKKLEKP